MTTPSMSKAEKIAAGLSERLRDALDYEERTHLEACELNALELVHMDVVKDNEGNLIDLRTNLTNLGQQVRAILQRFPLASTSDTPAS